MLDAAHGGRVAEHPQPFEPGPLDPASPYRHQHDVACDSIQPRRSRAIDLVAEASAGEPCLRERLRRQVMRGVIVVCAAAVVAEDRRGVPPVQLRKRGCVVT